MPLYIAFIISLLAQTKTLNLKICNFQQQNGIIIIIKSKVILFPPRNKKKYTVKYIATFYLTVLTFFSSELQDINSSDKFRIVRCTVTILRNNHNCEKKVTITSLYKSAHNSDFVTRNSEFLLRNSDFITRNYKFVPRNSDFITHNYKFVSRNSDFITCNYEFISCNSDFFSQLSFVFFLFSAETSFHKKCLQ